MAHKLLETNMPFKQKNSLIARAFVMCIEGTTRIKLKRFIERESGNVQRIFRVLRSGEYNEKKWKFDEDGRNIKIDINRIR